jgi:hypothetical protein
MLMETLIGAVAERIGASARERLTDFELHANGADPGAVGKSRRNPAEERAEHPPGVTPNSSLRLPRSL